MMSKRLKDSTAEIDREIGARIRRFRQLRDMSQEALAGHLGLTFQQLQKYEKGTNRVSASALVLICKALEISPSDVIGSFVEASTSVSGRLAQENAELKQRLAAIGRTASGRGAQAIPHAFGAALF